MQFKPLSLLAPQWRTEDEENLIFRNSDQIKFNSNLALDSLNKEKLCEIFAKAKEYYISGKNFYNTDLIGAKNFFTLGASNLFRRVKSNCRLPDENHITDENALRILQAFFNGPGDNDDGSLKYFVATILSSCIIYSDYQSDHRNLVSLVVTELNNKIGLVAKNDNSIFSSQPISAIIKPEDQGSASTMQNSL